MRRLWGFAAIAALIGTSSVPPMPLIKIKEEPRRGASRNLLKNSSRYRPHQGERECARRRRQLQTTE